ncbi:MAG: hypothetical protein R2851_10965 [Caldilineaceae bacterium]
MWTLRARCRTSPQRSITAARERPTLVCHGVPQAVVPHAADQQRQAQGVARTEVGFHIAPAQATVDNLTQALAQLLPDRSPYRAQARQLQHEFAALGGVPRAAALLEAVATDATA